MSGPGALNVRDFFSKGKARPSTVKHGVLVTELTRFLQGLEPGQSPTIIDGFSGAGVYGGDAAGDTATALDLAAVEAATTWEEARALFLSIPSEMLGSPLLCLQQALRWNRPVTLILVERSVANHASLLRALQAVGRLGHTAHAGGDDGGGDGDGDGDGDGVAVVQVGPLVRVSCRLGSFEEAFAPPNPVHAAVSWHGDGDAAVPRAGDADAAVGRATAAVKPCVLPSTATIITNPFFSFIDPYGHRGISLVRLTAMLALGPVVLYLATHTIKASYGTAQQAVPSAKIQRRLRAFFGGDWPRIGADVPSYYAKQAAAAAAAAARDGGQGSGRIGGVASKTIEMRGGKSHILVFTPSGSHGLGSG